MLNYTILYYILSQVLVTYTALLIQFNCFETDIRANPASTRSEKLAREKIRQKQLQ